MRKILFFLPAILCPLTLWFSATAQPYTLAADITWVLTWVSGISLLVTAGMWMAGGGFDMDNSETFVFSYDWHDGGSTLGVRIGNEYIDSLDERVPDAPYNKAVDVINRGAPLGRAHHEVPYRTEITVQDGRVVEIKDGFYDMRPQQVDGLFDQFCKEFNGPSVVWRIRRTKR